MFEDLGDVVDDPVLARLDAVLDDLVGLELGSCAGPDVLAFLAGLEARVRRSLSPITGWRPSGAGWQGSGVAGPPR